MFTRSELIDSIDELEHAPKTYQNMQKLATFYSIYDHLYGYSYSAPPQESVKQTIVDDFGDSEFLQSVKDKNADQIFEIIDELMETIRMLQPRLYEATLTEIRRL